MRHNTYTTKQSEVVQGKFKSLKNIIINDEINAAVSTRVRKSLSLKAASRWEFDFSEDLVFPDIEQVTYSVTSDSPFFHHLARTPQGGKVMIETNTSVDATVVVEVMQGMGK